MKCTKTQMQLPLENLAAGGPQKHNGQPPVKTVSSEDGQGVRQIQLTQGKFAIIDADAFAELTKHKWYYTSHGYAARDLGLPNGSHRTVYMHRVIAGVPDGLQTDHVNGNRLDNRACNLRFCTAYENAFNCGPPLNNSTGVKGVDFQKAAKKFRARIECRGKSIYLGLFTSMADAAKAYQAAANDLHGEFTKSSSTIT